MVSKDIVKEHLFDTVGFKNRQEKVALGIAALELMYHFANAQLEVGLSIILENNFENLSKPGLLKLIEKYNCRTLMVRFHTERTVLAERFLKRDKSPERHRGHVINTQYPELPPCTEPVINKNDTLNFESNLIYPQSYFTTMEERGMENFSIGCQEIIVDTTDFSKVSYEAVFHEILVCLGC